MEDLDPLKLLKKHQNNWSQGLQYTPMQRDMLISSAISTIAGAESKGYLQASRIVPANTAIMRTRFIGLPEFLHCDPSPGFDTFSDVLKYIPAVREHREGKRGNDSSSFLAIAADLAIWLHIWESEDWLERPERAKLARTIEVARHDGSLAAIRRTLPPYDGIDTHPLPAWLDNDIDERRAFRTFVLDFLRGYAGQL
jgi:hypothetical protein